MKIKLGNSNFQRQIEKEMLLLYAKKHDNIVFDEDSPILRGASVKIDGYSREKLVACEAYAHIGKLKPGQVHKVAQDALKLVYLDEKIGKKHKKVLLFADEQACKIFKYPEKLRPSQNAKWIADCLGEFKIDTWVAPLSPETMAELLMWQEKQGRKFRKKKS